MTESDVVECVVHVESDRLLKKCEKTSNVECKKQKKIHGTTQNKIIPSSSK